MRCVKLGTMMEWEEEGRRACNPTSFVRSTRNSSKNSVTPMRSKADHMASSAFACDGVSGRMLGPPWHASAIDMRDWQSYGLFQKHSGTRWLTKW